MSTKKIRIAVVMLQDGRWEAAGSHENTDDESLRNAQEILGRYGGWEFLVDVEIPIPEIIVVQGDIGDEHN